MRVSFGLYLHLHLAAQLRIEIAQGLVYKQDLGFRDERAGQRDAPLWLRQHTHGSENKFGRTREVKSSFDALLCVSLRKENAN